MTELQRVLVINKRLVCVGVDAAIIIIIVIFTVNFLVVNGPLRGKCSHFRGR